MVGRVINLLYSIYFNFRYLPISIGVKLPILIRANMKIERLQRGQIIVENVRMFSVRLGGQVSCDECTPRMY